MVTACRDDDAEAIAVARAVRAARTPGAAWAQQAVLVRTNAQATAIAALLERAGIPARLRASGSLLADATVRDALRSAGRSSLRLADWVEEFAESSSDDAALEPLLGYARRLLDEQPGAPAAALPGWATATARDDESARLRADGVDVVSFHAAKGLEWPIVHIAGFEEGYVPSSQAREEASLAEERRLLYVAVSRATRQVAFTWARRRHFGSRLVERRPSRWLQAIQGAGPSSDGAPAPADVDHVRSAREEARLALATTRPDPTFDALRARLERWRTHVARAADVPPSVVVPDVVLDRVVAASPTTLEELIAVEGMGVSCARTYGEQMLHAVAQAEEVDA
jgi:DNA helicase-2/ATP-dependent DNA helicase PcrA